VSVTKLGVVGGGQMGQGIAQVAAQAGLDVAIVDVKREYADAAAGKIKKVLDRLVERGKLDAGARDAALANLHPRDGHADLADRDFVIEAAPEHEPLKLEIMASLG
jgi:3-hydroxybutyryl-CoA dehydrogenase